VVPALPPTPRKSYQLLTGFGLIPQIILGEVEGQIPLITWLTSSLFREQTLDLATGVSRLRVRELGTVYRPYSGSLTLNLDTLNDF